jgi:hypothetical protein
MSQTKNKWYDILFECLLTKIGVIVHSSNASDENKGYDLLLDVLRRTHALWYTPRMAQINTKGMIYSSNVSSQNMGYGILLECLRQKPWL